MAGDASELARRLAREAEAVCRHYLSNGRREGRYWLVGDINNTPGRSLFVRLHASSKGPAGKWTDAATGEHGDLLDVIGTTCALRSFREIAEEARRFLKLPRWQREPPIETNAPLRSRDPTKAARRLFAMSQPLTATLGEAYLRNRGIDPLVSAAALRFHPQCFYRPEDATTVETWPAMIAAVTDLEDRITGVHRTWLDPDGFDDRRLGKAPIETPRRAMGDLLGHAVRFGIADDVLAAGEGIETMLSLRTVLPSLPVAAALSANHLATLLWPATLRRLYVAIDADHAGVTAAEALSARALDAGIEAIVVCPRLEDFNEDLCAFGKAQLRDMLRDQLLPVDVARFMDVIPA
ncbi:toprim domain-containing protein [Bradyrhizobium ontarionense]|uniref:Toprim domain-containing protein n=1 Tax=Bradyrhizobium ontarionense TaxID=2898149 RepID=A0ABY3R6H4_9BRAD|nr:toprim domain-containing protein [Bradyrhizobium sp. A19]UFZ02609.1 toprim domain-containing protein [Bradyrhizobium sp. A19]